MDIIMKDKRNRTSKYNVSLNIRIADRHESVIQEFMKRFNVGRSEAARMAFDASARYLLDT